jgi:hypothetical protein
MITVKRGPRRVVFRDVPGFTWVQVGIARPWAWNQHYWSVRGFARSHRWGPLWVCTMRADALDRIRQRGMPDGD